MPALHLLSNPQAAASCLTAVAPGDAILFIGDGVFSCLDADVSEVRLGLLHEDALSRGLTPPTTLELLTYRDFVDWVVDYPRSVTWR